MKNAAYNDPMKKGLVFFIILLFAVGGPAFSATAGQQKKKSPKDLPPQYRKWLTEEVVYIITQKESEVFLQLESDREREIFIDAFWKNRNPNPDSSQNDFKKEHYRRIEYANLWYGRSSPVPGWKTDMGRIYVILGDPRNVLKFENEEKVYPVIIWFYDGMAEYGLPNSFNVAFFKREIAATYEIYSPIRHGPMQLLIHYKGDMTDNSSAYLELLGIDSHIADISLSMIPGESQLLGTPSMSSDILIFGKIPAAPFVKVKDDYAEKLLKYKDMITVDYSANFIDSESVVSVFQDSAGMSFVHYCLEPRKLTFEKIQNRYHAEIEITGNVADAKGNTVYQFERTSPIDMNDDQMTKIKSKLFSWQDLFPMIPGKYKISVLFKNTVSKEFSSIEANILVPEPAQLSMSAPLLANRIDKNSKYAGSNKSFLLNNIQFVPSPRNDFTAGDTLYLFFQLHGLPDDVRSGGVLEYTILKDDDRSKASEKVHSLTKNLKDYADGTNFFEEFPLAGYAAAYYQIKVALLNANRQEILAAQVPFFITPKASLPRPWVLSIPQPPSSDPSFANILGDQHLREKDPAKARALLEQAYRQNPQNPKFAMDFCRILFLDGDYRGVKQTAAPFLHDEAQYDFLQLVGQASQALGEWAEAIASYKNYLTHFGTNIFILNAIGECYLQLGDVADALSAWEKSLQLSPNQEKIKAQVQSLKNKK